MDKDNITHIYNGIVVSHKREWNNAICSHKDGLGRHHAKQNKSHTERQILNDLLRYGILKKNPTN